jgi:hypothetical protein
MVAAAVGKGARHDGNGSDAGVPALVACTLVASVWQQPHAREMKIFQVIQDERRVLNL